MKISQRLFVEFYRPVSPYITGRKMDQVCQDNFAEEKELMSKALRCQNILKLSDLRMAQKH